MPMAEKVQLAIDYIEAHPDEAARILEEQPVGEAAAFLEHIDSRLAAKVLGQMLPAPSARCAREMSPDAAAMALARLRPIAAASILRCLPEETRKTLLNKMPKRIGFMCSVILNYAATVVGAWMDPLALAVPSTCSAAEARKRVRDDPYDDYRAVYVVNEARVLRGIVPLDTLIGADGDAPLSKFIRPAEFSLPDRSTLAGIANHAGWKVEDELPVLDRSQKFLGVMRYADLRRALAELMPEDATPDASGALLGFVEGSFLGLADIVNASLSITRTAETELTKESDHDR